MIGRSRSSPAGDRAASPSATNPSGDGRLSGVRVLVAHPGAELYGSDRVVLESVVAMVEAGAAVRVTVPESGPLVAKLEQVGATVVFEPAFVLRKRILRPRNWPSAAAALYRAFAAVRRLLRRRPDLIYVNTITLPLWPMAARVRGVPVLVHVHEAEADASTIALRAMYAPHLVATATIANSEFSRSIIARAYRTLAQRTRVVYNGVGGPPAATPARASLDGSPVRLAYLGRLSPRKGPDLVIAAAAELVDGGVDVRVDLLGEVFPGYEWYATALREAVADRGMEARVRFLGFLDEVWAALQLADVVVIPSPVSEPFGNTAVEAALAARPLVVSSTSGLIEATEGLPGVLRVTPADASAIADAVREIITHWPEHRDRAEESARVASRRFDPGRYRESIVGLVETMVHDDASVARRREGGGMAARV